MIHCGGDRWDESIKKVDVVDCRLLASIWATNNLTGIVISNQFNSKTNPTFRRNGVLIFSPWQLLGYGLFFCLLYRLRKLSKTDFILSN